MATNDEAPEVTNVDDIVLRDLESKFSTVKCPVHDLPPRFETAADGSVVEYMCCEALRDIIRELQAQERVDPTDGVAP